MHALLQSGQGGGPGEPGEHPSRRLPSGTRLVLAGLVLCVAVVLLIVFVSPMVERELVALGTEVEEDVLASDLLPSGDAFVLTAESDGDRACFTVDVAQTEQGRLCAPDAPAPAAPLGAVRVVAAPDDDVWFLAGVAEEGASVVRLTLDDGERRVLQPIDAPEGYPASFYATVLRPDRRVTGIELVDLDERTVASLRCAGPVATATGVGQDCALRR